MTNGEAWHLLDDCSASNYRTMVNIIFVRWQRCCRHFEFFLCEIALADRPDVQKILATISTD
jgi:hypothetical protein